MSTSGDPRRLIGERLRREEVLPHIAEPGWFMLLGLLVASQEGKYLTIADAIAYAFSSASSAHRHLVKLVEEGLVRRFADPVDGRRTFVAITEKGESALTTYFEGRIDVDRVNPRLELSVERKPRQASSRRRA